MPRTCEKTCSLCQTTSWSLQPAGSVLHVHLSLKARTKFKNSTQTPTTSCQPTLLPILVQKLVSNWQLMPSGRGSPASSAICFAAWTTLRLQKKRQFEDFHSSGAASCALDDRLICSQFECNNSAAFMAPGSTPRSLCTALWKASHQVLNLSHITNMCQSVSK